MIYKNNHILTSLVNKRLISGIFGDFHHCSIVFTKKRGVLYPISYGENQIRKNKSIHAEVDAINRTKTRKTENVRKLCLLVIRVNKNREITTSKPCKRCIEQMNKTTLKNYKISTIYYSDCNGEIIKTSLHRLLSDPCKHISRMESRRK